MSDDHLTKEDLSVMKRLATSDRFGTHWDTCYLNHPRCAILRLVREVERLSLLVNKLKESA